MKGKVGEQWNKIFMEDPQQEFEAGEQKGGNAGCPRCSGDARKYKELTVSLT